MNTSKTKYKIFDSFKTNDYKIERVIVEPDSKTAYEIVSFIKEIYGYTADVETMVKGSFDRKDLVFYLIRLKRNNKIVASASRKLHEGIVWINNVGVQEEYRGKGLGKMVMLELLKHETECRLRCIKSSAMEFYKTLGFEVINFVSLKILQRSGELGDNQYDLEAEGQWEMIWKKK